MAAVQPEPWLRALITNNNNNPRMLLGQLTFFALKVYKFYIVFHDKKNNLLHTSILQFRHYRSIDRMSFYYEVK
jgi:hypothetical protein